MKKLGQSLLIMLLITGCNPAPDTALGELNRLRSNLSAKTSCKINVSLKNNSHITIELLNSRFKALPEEQKKTLTREIARYVLANYRRAGKLETVNVGFVTQKSFMNFNYTDYSDSQQYLVSELKNGEM